MLSTQVCRRTVSLRRALPQARFLAGKDVLAQSCSADWRTCREGDVFFALTTADDDGHEHARAAIQRGAAAVVVERLVAVDVPQVLVEDSRVALGCVCQALAGEPSAELRTIGITGSAGKTVTAMLIASVCEAAGERAGVMSSLGHSDSVVQQAPTNADPTAPEFASWLARMNAAGCSAAVLELSSQTLAQHAAAGIGLAAAVITNLKNEHPARHNSAQAYVRIKGRVLDMLREDGLAVINADDHRCQRLLADRRGPTLTYAIHAEADITASVLERSASEQTFLLSAGDDAIPVRTRMIGDQHVSNCLAAAAVGLWCGVDLATIVRGLEAVERVPGRLERIECGQSFGVFIDAAASPETLALAIKTARQVTSGRVIVVYGPGKELDAARRALAGRVLERGAHLAVITSDEPGEKRPLQTAHDVLDGFTQPARPQIVPGRTAAIEFALHEARPGDTVLIAGRGDRVTTLRGGRTYDDCEAVRSALFGAARQQSSRPHLRVVG
jgi:UDP-N-acetylmuramoyl-L-alanyl-D-glutamate--2,6-diaminopimelate ligase